jgi:hypothetical protein
MAKPGPAKSGKAHDAEGLGAKAIVGGGEVVGDGRLRRPDTLSGETCAAPASSRPGTGVRALIVALKPGNAGGAKGGRKVEMERAERSKQGTGLVPAWLYLTGKADAPARSYAARSIQEMQMLRAFARRSGERGETLALYTSHGVEACAFVVYGPLGPNGETTNWRAVCGRTARTVRREGAARVAPYPYRKSMIPEGAPAMAAPPARSRRGP